MWIRAKMKGKSHKMKGEMNNRIKMSNKELQRPIKVNVYHGTLRMWYQIEIK